MEALPRVLLAQDAVSSVQAQRDALFQQIRAAEAELQVRKTPSQVWATAAFLSAAKGRQ